MKSDNLRLTAELNEFNRQVTEATELKEVAEQKVAYFTSIARAVEIDKEKLQQEVQNLTGVVEHFKSTTVNSLDDFTNKLKFDLKLFAGKPSVEDSK